MLEAIGVSKRYCTDNGWVSALERVDLQLGIRDRLGLMGKSGSGKSTLAKVLSMLIDTDEGFVAINGTKICGAGLRVSRRQRTKVQLLWQSPRSAVDSRLRVKDIILEPLAANSMLPRDAKRCDSLLHDWSQKVGIGTEILSRFPHEVSDGQLQRICLARALILRPDYLICDELTSSLDVSNQAALLQVIAMEQQERALGVLLISHDRHLVSSWCSSILNLNAGRLQIDSSRNGCSIAATTALHHP